MRIKSEKGQAMVEFALILPILVLILCGIIDFGWIFGNQLLANNAAREAARYTAVHYNDSSTDNDQQTARGIVLARAPTLDSPTVNLTHSGDSVTVTVNTTVEVLTPIIAAFFPDGECDIEADCEMRLE
jgi:Flp pilus assembly protein TadG